MGIKAFRFRRVEFRIRNNDLHLSQRKYVDTKNDIMPVVGFFDNCDTDILEMKHAVHDLFGFMPFLK